MPSPTSHRLRHAARKAASQRFSPRIVAENKLVPMQAEALEPAVAGGDAASVMSARSHAVADRHVRRAQRHPSRLPMTNHHLRRPRLVVASVRTTMSLQARHVKAARLARGAGLGRRRRRQMIPQPSL